MGQTLGIRTPLCSGGTTRFAAPSLETGLPLLPGGRRARSRLGVRRPSARDRQPQGHERPQRTHFRYPGTAASASRQHRLPGQLSISRLGLHLHMPITMCDDLTKPEHGRSPPRPGLSPATRFQNPRQTSQSLVPHTNCFTRARLQDRLITGCLGRAHPDALDFRSGCHIRRRPTASAP